jgi:hypothetical protein
MRKDEKEQNATHKNESRLNQKRQNMECRLACYLKIVLWFCRIKWTIINVKCIEPFYLRLQAGIERIPIL